MYVKAKKREYLQLNKYIYNSEQNFFYILRNLFPKIEVKRATQRGGNKYNSGAFWYLESNLWFIAHTDEENDVKAISITGEGKEGEIIQRRISIQDDQIDLAEMRMKVAEVQKWLKQDDLQFKKKENLILKLHNLRRAAKVSPQDSKIFVDFEDTESDKFELVFHFLNEWETSSLIKFYQGLTSGKYELYLREIEPKEKVPTK